MLKLLTKLPFYWSYRKFGWPEILPFSVVVSVSYRCNSKCQTCDVWRKPNDDMTLEEWDKTFAQLGPGSLYFTFTGGEPFLRKDTADMALSAYKHCQPSVITIPTNGILTKRIINQVDKLCRGAPKAKIGINLSLDDVAERHDEIRLVPGNWQKALKTWSALKELQKEHGNLVLSTHTVISKYNIDRFFHVYAGLEFLEPDSYITEIAEERVELDTVGWGITPTAQTYGPIADFLSQRAKARPVSGFAKITQAFRAEYYQLAKRTLYEHRQVIPCYAGWASCQIAPNGDVWSCCIRAEGVGNLRDHDYDLRPIWRGDEMANLRQSIYQGECDCPMANASYANMVLHPPTLAKVGATVLSS
ncbi:radical SAM protein [Anaerolineales bacterium HSG6]|nr:radical SAM protein [Anaerolineales bacterium HSG6]